jgi:hypothetical protein
MKKIYLLFLSICYLIVTEQGQAQTNLFPSIGDAEIKTGKLVLETSSWRESLLTFKDTHYSPIQLYKFQIESDGLKLWQDNNVNYQFKSGGDFIVNNGKVGIGTYTPAGKLDVNHPGGQIRLSGGIVAAGLWTNSTDMLYLADWNTGTKGLNINMSNGNVGIGTFTPDFKLTVNGKIKTEEVQVVVDVPADYVFDERYHLRPLEEVDKFIKEYKHLPGIPSSELLKIEGWQLGEMQNKLLEKIEELTLYLIEIKKENYLLKERLERLENR